MKQRTISMQELPAYMYQILPNGYVDIFVSKFIETEEVEEEGKTSIQYVYETNQFQIEQGLISEEDIRNNPEDYLDFKIEKISMETRMNNLENIVLDFVLGGIE